jgi:hypothetical protein
MKDAVLRLPISTRPRILGLTGSFNNGSVKQLQRKRQALEEVLTAQIFCPDMQDFEATQSKTFTTVSYVSRDCHSVIEFIEKETRLILSRFKGRLRDKSEAKKILGAAVDVFQNLGLRGFVYFMREGVLQQLEAKACLLRELGLRWASSLLAELPQLQQHLSQQVSTLLLGARQLGDTHISAVSPKCRRLLQLLGEQQRELGSLRAVVFVSRVATTYPLADLLNRYFSRHPRGTGSAADAAGGWSSSDVGAGGSSSEEDDSAAVIGGGAAPRLSAEPVSGTSSMGEAEREGRLSRFRSGALSILVATSSLEEGLDIPECNLVVRYDKVLTTKLHVQGSGRARVFLFQNQAQAEEEKRQEMEAVARDVSIALSSTDIEARLAVETARQQKAGMPYPFLHPAAPHAEVNVFNATLVVHQYIQKTMGQGFLPNVHLFHQRLDSLGGCPPVVRAVLLAASYPSPDGVVVVHALQVNSLERGRGGEEEGGGRIRKQSV